jgi:hypothetical protein
LAAVLVAVVVVAAGAIVSNYLKIGDNTVGYGATLTKVAANNKESGAVDWTPGQVFLSTKYSIGIKITGSMVTNYAFLRVNFTKTGGTPQLTDLVLKLYYQGAWTPVTLTITGNEMRGQVGIEHALTMGSQEVVDLSLTYNVLGTFGIVFWIEVT